MPNTLTRRSLLASAAAAPLASALPAWATAPMLGPSEQLYNRFKLGSFEVTTLLAGSAVRDEPQSMFGMNVSKEEFDAVSEQALIPNDKVQFVFTPTVVNTGTQLVLFDTGLSAEGTVKALEAAGYTADMVDLVVITHMHPDHIGGNMNNGAPTFPNAAYATAAAEFDAWAKAGNDLFESNMRPLADNTAMMDDGAAGFSGHTAMAAYGHTPGHMIHLIESDGEGLVIAGDFANHYIWSLAHPDWEVKFDMDKAAAAETRRRVLGMLASEKLPFVGYHMPWPGTGFVEAKDDGFEYVPTSYQLLL